MASYLFRPFRSTPSPAPPPPPSPTPAPAEPSAMPPAPLTDLLSAYTSPDQDGTVAVTPKGSRVDQTLTQSVGRRMILGWGLGDLWNAGWFIANKANHLATDLVTHTVYGPRKKSWGLEMTIITSFMRDMGKHSSLAEIGFIRGLIALTSYVPLPASALVTPVSFRVRCRQLRGILKEFDDHERGGSEYTGSGKGRELTGEWVVDKALWAGWQNEFKQGKSRKRRSGEEDAKKKDGGMKGGDRIVLYLHGGAYYTASAASHRLITIQVAQMCEARVFAINYRLAPETRFPGPLHDAVSAYFRLIDDLKIPPENIIIAGDSAGGGLSLALLMYLRDHDYPLPSGAILMSPWVDLTMSCDSWDSNAPFDIIPRPEPNDHLNPIFCYLGEEGVKKYLTHPYASPLFGDFEGLPPLLIQSGEAEVLRDEHILLAHKATLAGVLVMHEMFEDAVHVFMAFPFLEATRIAFQSQRDFVLSVLPSHSSTSLQPLGPAETAALGSEIETADAKVVSGVGAELSSEEEQRAKERWEREAAAAVPMQRSDTASSVGTEEDDALGTPSTDQGAREVEDSLLKFKTGLRADAEAEADVDLERVEAATEDDDDKTDTTSHFDTFRTPRSRPTILPTINEPPPSTSSSRDPSPALRPPRLTRAVTAFVTSTASSLTSHLRSPSSSSATSSPTSQSTSHPLPPFATSPRTSTNKRRLPQLNVHVQELLPKPPKTRSRSASHPEVCDLVRRFSDAASLGPTAEGEGEAQGDGVAQAGRVVPGHEKSPSTGGGAGPGSPYRVKLYTPGKGGGGARRRDEAEVEDAFGGGV